MDSIKIYDKSVIKKCTFWEAVTVHFVIKKVHFDNFSEMIVLIYKIHICDV